MKIRRTRRAAACLLMLGVLCGCAGRPPLPYTPSPGDGALMPAVATLPPTPEPTAEPISGLEPAEFATPEPEEGIDFYTPPAGMFSVEDLVMMGVGHGSSAQEVLAELGEPMLREEDVEETTGLRRVTYVYDGLFAGLLGGASLSSMTVVTADWPGPRDVWVGAAVDEVLAAFGLDTIPVTDADMGPPALSAPNGVVVGGASGPIPLMAADGASETDASPAPEPARQADAATATDAPPARTLPMTVGDVTTYYGDLLETGHILPPKAELSRVLNENGDYVLRLFAPLEPYTERDRLHGGYYYRQHAACLFYFNGETDEVTRIHWFVGPLTEG